MKQNIGAIDRVIRLALGTLLLIWGIITGSGLAVLAGLFTLYEALSSWCVFYQLIGRNTCPLPNNKRSGIPLLKPFILGLTILITAILMNIIASFLGWKSWYQFLGDWNKILTLDNYLFLFIAYPFSLGMSVMYVNSKWFKN